MSFTAKYSHEKPIIYEQCREKFGVDWDSGIIIVYGDVIHCKYLIPDHLKAHEEVHVNQQMAMGKYEWWRRYFADKVFRMTQEVEAYRAQIEFAKATMNREGRRKLKEQIIKDAVETHGNMCTRAQIEAHLYS